jgi:hypothetical protein
MCHWKFLKLVAPSLHAMKALYVALVVATLSVAIAGITFYRSHTTTTPLPVKRPYYGWPKHEYMDGHAIQRWHEFIDTTTLDRVANTWGVINMSATQQIVLLQPFDGSFPKISLPERAAISERAPTINIAMLPDCKLETQDVLQSVKEQITCAETGMDMTIHYSLEKIRKTLRDATTAERLTNCRKSLPDIRAYHAMLGIVVNHENTVNTGSVINFWHEGNKAYAHSREDLCLFYMHNKTEQWTMSCVHLPLFPPPHDAVVHVSMSYPIWNWDIDDVDNPHVVRVYFTDHGEQYKPAQRYRGVCRAHPADLFTLDQDKPVFRRPTIRWDCSSWLREVATAVAVSTTVEK